MCRLYIRAACSTPSTGFCTDTFRNHPHAAILRHLPHDGHCWHAVAQARGQRCRMGGSVGVAVWPRVPLRAMPHSGSDPGVVVIFKNMIGVDATQVNAWAKLTYCNPEDMIGTLRFFRALTPSYRGASGRLQNIGKESKRRCFVGCSTAARPIFSSNLLMNRRAITIAFSAVTSREKKPHGSSRSS